MPVEINVQQYALFEQIVRLLEGHVIYKVMMPGPRTFEGSEKDQLPWGTLDAIISVKWYPAGEPGYGHDADRRHVELTYSGSFQGIHVRSDLMETSDIPALRYNSHVEILGLNGIIKPRVNCIGFDTEDAISQRIQEIIDRAVEVLDEEKRIQRDHAEFDDMADLYDFDYHVERGTYEY
jgi:hypothetical protein